MKLAATQATLPALSLSKSGWSRSPKAWAGLPASAGRGFGRALAYQMPLLRATFFGEW